ncbi:intron Large complex component GCFC2 isoform X2 [Ochotona princeps]|uniref:intron Large complex component GCFC2 isoform X2 n=1 Tax=Ochotona princeps TaxID=9978 RepID=UPI00271551B7|nr:intron Large complex component GCFC2 isoform X2 [Ochotona princeps]
MAHKPKRTFRQRRANDSDSDGTEEPPLGLGTLKEKGQPAGEERAEAEEGRRRAPGLRGRGRGRVWASSRRAAGAAARSDRGSGAPDSRVVDLSSDEEGGSHDSSASEGNQSPPSDTSRPLAERPLSAGEEAATPYSSGSKGDETPSSESSSSLEEKTFSSAASSSLFSSVKIPDAAVIQAARRKRELARAQDDYISLNVKQSSTLSGLKGGSDEDTESEPDDPEARIPFTSKPQTLRQRMAEETTSRHESTNEENQEDENQYIWEEQQMRRAVKTVERGGKKLSHNGETPTVKKLNTFVSFRPVNLEIIKKQLNARLTLLQDTHRSHKREYEKYLQDVESSKSAIQNLESSSNQNLNYKFYKSMKIYVENLIGCLNEKVINIQEIESSMHALLLKQATTLVKRRQDELKHESTHLQQLSCKAETDGSLAIDEKTQWILEEIESRRQKRRQTRALSGESGHQEGASSDDELSSAEMSDFQNRSDDIIKDHKKVFEDVHDDFCNIQSILLRFQQWREKFPDSYYEAYISLCIPKLLNPLIRAQLISWNPLKLDSIGLKQMLWFTSVEEFVDNSVENSNKDNSDKKIFSTIINKTVIPRLKDFIEFIWDPLSTTQTRSLVRHCSTISEELSTCENEVNTSKPDLFKIIILRMKKAIEDDVFIPLYPKSAIENKKSPHSEFQERQFWSSLKLFRNILLWNGLLQDDTLQELGLGKLLNRYLMIALFNADPGPEVVKKCIQIAACLPEKWFENSAMRTSIPQLGNFIKVLLQSAHKLSASEFRDEIKEIILILVKIKALNQAEFLIQEYHLDTFKSLIGV